MSIRLDPRRVGVLKRLAAETGVRPGDLVRQWVEERLDAVRQGIETPEAAADLNARLAELAERVAGLEAAIGSSVTGFQPDASEDSAEPQLPEPAPEPATATDAPAAAADAEEHRPRARTKRVAAKPSGPRIALHDEMIAVLAERGPMPAGELAAAIAERGRYQPPRSGKPLDAAMVSQRVSNPAYRSRFSRQDGRIGLAEPAE